MAWSLTRPASTTERIAEDADYEGVRAKFLGRLGNTRVTMQIDIGFSDVVTPGPAWVSYPTILEQPSVQLLAYNRETAIAEKFEAMVKLGDLNTRMKDFFDVWLLAANFEFDALSLLAAIRATFAQRQTPLEVVPIGLSDVFGRDPSKDAQWRAFLGRSTPIARTSGVLRGRGPCPRLPQPIAQAISRANRSQSTGSAVVPGSLKLARRGNPTFGGHREHARVWDRFMAEVTDLAVGQRCLGRVFGMPLQAAP